MPRLMMAAINRSRPSHYPGVIMQAIVRTLADPYIWDFLRYIPQCYGSHFNFGIGVMFWGKLRGRYGLYQNTMAISFGVLLSL